jgi:hypothetical protein
VDRHDFKGNTSAVRSEQCIPRVNADGTVPATLQARVGAAAFSDVGSSAAPLSLRTWPGPTSNENVNFSQVVNSNDPRRTGRYSKTLTFTLSTTSP